MGGGRPSTRETVRQAVVFLLLFLLGNLLASLACDLLFRGVELPAGWMYRFVRGAASLGLPWLLLWWYTTRRLRLRMADFGIRLSLRRWALPCALLLPAFVAGAHGLLGEVSVRAVPPGEAAGTVAASLMAALAAGITEEMTFRGYLMTLVRRRWGAKAAVLYPSVLFAALHLPGMDSFTPAGAALLLAGGTLVGVMFSLAAEKGGSVANSALLHTLWNLVMITDILHVATPAGSWGRPLAAVTITRGGLLFTGGPFGVEVSLFALMGYGAVCAAILLLERGRD